MLGRAENSRKEFELGKKSDKTELNQVEPYNWIISSIREDTKCLKTEDLMTKEVIETKGSSKYDKILEKI